MALPMVPPRVMAATAIAAPMMARIRAYSAAEAPDSSCQKRTSLLMLISLPHLSGVADPVGPTRQIADYATFLAARAFARDAVAGGVHGVADGAAESDRRNRNGRADNRQNESIFGRRSAGLALPQTDELVHFQF